MNLRTKTVTSLAVLGAAASGGILWLRGEPAPEAREPQQAEAPAPVKAPPRDDQRARCEFEVGDRLAYALSIDSSAVVYGQRMGAGGGALQTSQKVRATLDLEALRVDEDGAVLLSRFSDVEVEGAEADLRDPFLVRVKDCRIAGFGRHRDAGVSDARTVQGLAHELGYAPVAAGRSRSVEGDNTTGHYRATVTSQTPGTLTRTVEGYTALWDRSGEPGPDGIAARPRESESVIELDDALWFASIERHEALTGVAAADLRQTAQVERAASTDGSLADADRTLTHYVWENLLPRVKFRRAKRPVTKRDLRAQAAVRGDAFEDQVAEFVVRSRTLENFAETWPPMATYLEARPEMAEPFAHALRTGMVPPEGRAGGWLAIGHARTEEAREVLLDVMRDPSALAVNRTRAMFALLDRDDVDAELTRELGAQALAVTQATDKQERFFARESALAMGMMAGLRGEEEPEVLQVAMATVPKLLATQTRADDLRSVFGSMANIGHPSLLAKAQPYTASKDPEVRAVAAVVVRRLSPLASNDFVADWLEHEPDADVKREIYVTASKQSHDTRTPAGNQVLDHAIADLKAKPGVIARRAIIKLLGEAASSYPPARRALMAQARVEVKEGSGLYTVIAQYLSADDLSAGLAQVAVNP